MSEHQHMYDAFNLEEPKPSLAAAAELTSESVTLACGSHNQDFSLLGFFFN